MGGERKLHLLAFLLIIQALYLTGTVSGVATETQKKKSAYV